MSSVVNTPVKAIEEINNIIQNFIWDGSTSKLSQKNFIQQIDKGGLTLCHFETIVNALKLSRVKRLVSEKDSMWKILPKLFYNCHNLNKYINANHNLLSNNHIPFFNREIHSLFMKFFKKEPDNLIEILDQQLWLNKYILINNKHIMTMSMTMSMTMTIFYSTITYKLKE